MNFNIFSQKFSILIASIVLCSSTWASDNGTALETGFAGGFASSFTSQLISLTGTGSTSLSLDVPLPTGTLITGSPVTTTTDWISNQVFGTTGGVVSYDLSKSTSTASSAYYFSGFELSAKTVAIFSVSVDLGSSFQTCASVYSCMNSNSQIKTIYSSAYASFEAYSDSANSSLNQTVSNTLAASIYAIDATYKQHDCLNCTIISNVGTLNSLTDLNGLEVGEGSYSNGVLSIAYLNNTGTTLHGNLSLGISAITQSTTLVTPVPEPEAYAMLLAGIGLIGSAVKRRKAKQG